jgi:hypothetical protein
MRQDTGLAARLKWLGHGVDGEAMALMGRLWRQAMTEFSLNSAGGRAVKGRFFPCPSLAKQLL